MTTIVQTIKQAMKEAGRPLTAKEAYEFIESKKLYQFKAKNPQSVVASTIRKHCKGLERKNASNDRCFEEIENGVYKLV